MTTEAEVMATPSPLSIVQLASEPAAAAVARLLADQLGATVTSVEDRRECQETLQHNLFHVVLLEETVTLENPAAAEALYQAAGQALVLEINFGLASADRVLRQVRCALAHRMRDEQKTRAALKVTLQNELSASLSGLLLESQLALHHAAPEAVPLLDHLVRLAESLCQQLRA